MATLNISRSTNNTQTNSLLQVLCHCLFRALNDTEHIPLYAAPVAAAHLFMQQTAQISGCELYCLVAYTAAPVLLTIYKT